MGSVPAGRKKRADVAGGPQTFRSPTAIIIWWVWLLFAVANLVDLAVQGRDHVSLVAAAILLLATGVAYVTAQRPRIIADSGGVTVVNPLRDHHIGWAGVTRVDLADLLRIHCQEQGRDKAIYSWAVHYSRRRKFAAEAKARRTAARPGRRSAFGLESFGGGSGDGYGSSSGSGRRGAGYGSDPARDAVSTAEAEAERIARVLSEYATTARAETAWAGGSVAIAGAPPSAGQVEPAAAPAAVAEDGVTDPRVAAWLEPLTSTWNPRALLALLIPALILLVVVLV
jgi:Bacterial PH domain